ncbi:MAG: flagellar M-ring protein FliF [Candidatus Muirbacterium halophilum]|nr:flagellar M-ring protein FliF [Candidatus Muirbacterium halophilum]MCK9474346.1 flagellar M-ring protein FliF [Candidatus Muirbacterium halophilum]
MDFKAIIEKIKVNFSNLRKEQQILLYGIIGASAITLLFLMFWGGKQEWSVLFAGLSPKESSKIVNELKNKAYDYQLEAGGNNILVLTKHRSEIMLELAGSDTLPEKNVTWESLFKNTSVLGQTKQREKIDYVRGIQGELEYTIGRIDQIVNARVHVNIPAEKLFKEDEVDPTAAVMLKLRPFEDITVENIRAIQNLVAFSIEGMFPENVKVVDSSGKILSDQVDYQKDDASKTMTIIQIQKEFEKDLAKKSRQMLDKVLGPDNSDVKISVEFDFDKIETTIKNFSPPIPGEDTGIKRSEEKEAEKYEGTGKFPGGVPGTDSNIPGYKAIEGDSSKYTRDKLISNYEINSEQKNLIKTPGSLKRLTISVLVNDNRKLTVEEKSGLQEAVKNAVGFNDNRGDTISLTQIHFDKEWYQKMLDEIERERRMKLIMTLATIASIVFIIMTILAVRWYRNYQVAKRRRMAQEEEVEQVVEIEEEFEPIISIEEQERKEMHDRIKRIAQQDPENVSKLLKAWMLEE